MNNSRIKQFRDLKFKRVLVVTQYYYPETGAPQIRLRAMINELIKNDIEVEVLTGMPNYPEGRIHEGYRGYIHRDEKIDGISVKRLWLYPAGEKRLFMRVMNYISFTLHACLHAGHARKFDFVFIEAQPFTLAFFGIICRFLFGIPYIYNTPDLQIEAASQTNWVKNKIFLQIALKLETFLMKKAFSVSTVTHAFIDHFVMNRGIPREKMTFLPNGVDLKILYPLPYDEAYAKKLAVNGKTVFAYTGTHANYQGLDVIIDAAEILKDDENIVFLMIGKGPERSRLIETARKKQLNNVIFSTSPFNETSKLMSITYASIVVLRNIPISGKMRLSKTFPPLACGVPVIYAGIGESADIVNNYNCGIVTPPENAQELSMAIKELAKNRKLRDILGRNGRDLVVRDFSWGKIVKEWLEQIYLLSYDKTI